MQDKLALLFCGLFVFITCVVSAADDSTSSVVSSSLYEISKLDDSGWKLAGKEFKDLVIRLHLYKASPNTQKLFDERKKSRMEYIKFLSKQVKEAPTEELKKSSKEEIIAFEKGQEFTGDWPKWPIVMLSPIYSVEGNLKGQMFICQSQDRKVDLVLVLSDSVGPDYEKALDIARKIIVSLNLTSSLLESNKSIFDSEGNMVAKELEAYSSTNEFIRQH